MMMHPLQGESVDLPRDVDAAMVPMGNIVNLPQGTRVNITQSLGGSFTVYIDGTLFRIAGTDADALDKEVIPPPELPENATDEDVEKLVWDQMKTVFDPEIPVNIVDLGLIYTCHITKNEEEQRIAHVTMTLTAPGCGMGPFIADDVKYKIEIIPTIKEANVEVVFDPAWSKDMMSDEAKLQTGIY